MSTAPLHGGLYVGQPGGSGSGGGSSSQVTNASDVPGATVSDALNVLYRVQYRPDVIAAGYEFTLSDVGRTVVGNSEGAQTFTFQPGLGWEVGDVITVWQKGAGRIAIAAGNGAIILPSTSYQPVTFEQNAIVTAQCVAFDTWLLSGERLPV
jgi:hypothetical protein